MVYRATVADLHTALDNPEARTEAAEIVRGACRTYHRSRRQPGSRGGVDGRHCETAYPSGRHCSVSVREFGKSWLRGLATATICFSTPCGCRVCSGLPSPRSGVDPTVEPTRPPSYIPAQITLCAPVLPSSTCRKLGRPRTSQSPSTQPRSNTFRSRRCRNLRQRCLKSPSCTARLALHPGCGVTRRACRSPSDVWIAEIADVIASQKTRPL